MLRNWLRRRHAKQARHDAAMGQLLDEYTERIEAGDPDALEAARDNYNNDNVPWNAEVGLALGLLVLLGSVFLLTALFMWIRHLTGG